MLLTILSMFGVTAMAMLPPILGSPRPQPPQQRWGQDQDNHESQELNEVWAPGPYLRPYKHFDSFSFKSIVKALGRLRIVVKPEEATPFPQELPDPSGSPDVLIPEDLLEYPTTGPLEDNTLNVKPDVKPEKSYRFTSFPQKLTDPSGSPGVTTLEDVPVTTTDPPEDHSFKVRPPVKLEKSHRFTHFPQELPEPSESPDITTPQDVPVDPTSSPLEDDPLNFRPIVKPDKSYRFTHNFRFGYGAMPGLP